jgi:protein arginine kinase activator
MLCDVCGQNLATVHLIEEINNKKTELRLCEECARKKGAFIAGQHFAIGPDTLKNLGGLAELMAGLVDLGTTLGTAGESEVMRCSNCKMTYDDFKKLGKLGCGGCYDAFRKSLSPLLRKIHGSGQHIGKATSISSKSLKAKFELQTLQSRLAKAIQAEEFEEAAVVRDKIRELEREFEAKAKRSKR